MKVLQFLLSSSFTSRYMSSFSFSFSFLLYICPEDWYMSFDCFLYSISKTPMWEPQENSRPVIRYVLKKINKRKKKKKKLFFWRRFLFLFFRFYLLLLLLILLLFIEGGVSANLRWIPSKYFVVFLWRVEAGSINFNYIKVFPENGFVFKLQDRFLRRFVFYYQCFWICACSSHSEKF